MFAEKDVIGIFLRRDGRCFMSQRVKTRVYEILWRTRPGDKFADIVILFILLLVFSNVVAFVMSTLPGFFAREYLFFVSLIVFSLVAFTIEYILRLWSCTIDSKYNNVIKGRIRFILTSWSILTLLVIIPLWIVFITKPELPLVRAAFLFLLLRLFQGSGSFRVLVQIVKAKKSDLALALLIDVIVLVFASSLMWFIESPVNPKMASIPETMWWGTATLTTVGYGDVVPVTALGRVLGVVVMFAGIATFALPISIVGAGFLEVREQKLKDNEAEQKIGRYAVLDQIEKLGDLKDRGILTEEEFQSKKTDLLSRL
jgi:voltage-gated potassium channel